MTLAEVLQNIFDEAHASIQAAERRRDEFAEAGNEKYARVEQSIIDVHATRRDAAGELLTRLNSLGADAAALLCELVPSSVAPLSTDQAAPVVTATGQAPREAPTPNPAPESEADPSAGEQPG